MFFFFQPTTEEVGNKPASRCLCNSSTENGMSMNGSFMRYVIGFIAIAVLAVGSALILVFNNTHAGEIRLASARGIATSPATQVER